jgi:hypothetical protein
MADYIPTSSLAWQRKRGVRPQSTSPKKVNVEREGITTSETVDKSISVIFINRSVDMFLGLLSILISGNVGVKFLRQRGPLFFPFLPLLIKSML